MAWIVQALCCVLLGCGPGHSGLQDGAKGASSGSPAPPSTVPAPRAAAALDRTGRDGEPITVRLSTDRRVILQANRRNQPSGLSAAQCAVTVDGRTVATIGSGPTEVYTCDGLVAAGAVPARNGVRRIGLIYDVSSPNTSFRTAVVLVEAGTGWQVDEALAGKFDGGPAGRSMAGLRAALKERRQR